MICDTDRDVLSELNRWLEDNGEEVFSYNNGLSALDDLKNINPDIVFVAQNIDNIDSIEFIEKVQSIDPSIATMMMLDSDLDPLLFKKLIDIQVDKYIYKPIDMSILSIAYKSITSEKVWYKESELQKRVLQEYKDAIDSSFNVSKHDKDGNVFYINDSFCETMMLTREEALSGKLNPLQNNNADMNLVWDILNKNEIYRDRQIFKCGDKRDKIIDVTAIPMLNSDKNINEFLVISSDVSEVVYSARKIKNQEIEKKLQKLDHVKELNRVKDSFLTLFTHELKTPLNTIINFSEYIKKHLLKEEFKKRDTLVEQVSQVHVNGLIMLDMIANLIDSMKLRDGTFEFKKSEFLLNSLLDEIVGKYSDELQNNNVKIDYDKDCYIYSDENVLRQILGNLLSNASKYSKKDIVISLKSNEKNFLIEVMDDGEGFADYNVKIELFKQSGEDNMTRTAKGTGVGLYFVQETCNNLGYLLDISKSKSLGGARVAIKGQKDSR